MTKPIVTVITPTYNCGRYIEETVKSVLSQDYDNLHYLVIDDGSTDNTRDILNKWDRVIYIYQANEGEAGAVNNGLRRVKGDYFMITNADDPLLPGAIDTLVNFMESHPDVLCAYPCWNTIGENGEYRQHFDQGEYNFKYMVRHCMCQPSVGSMFRSTVIKSVGLRDPQFKLHSDFDYWLRIGLVGKMARVPETLATFRVREGQQSKNNSDARAQEFIKTMDKFFLNKECAAFYPYQMTDDLWRLRWKAWCWSYLIAAGITDSRRKSMVYLWKAITTYPAILCDFEGWDHLIKRAYGIIRR